MIYNLLAPIGHVHAWDVSVESVLGREAFVVCRHERKISTYNLYCFQNEIFSCGMEEEVFQLRACHVSTVLCSYFKLKIFLHVMLIEFGAQFAVSVIIHTKGFVIKLKRLLLCLSYKLMRR